MDNVMVREYSTEGDTLVPLHYELPVTLLLEHIPLAATDYFIGRCRREYTTDVETICGIVRIIFIFLRLIWYDIIQYDALACAPKLTGSH